jgi:hypothetical protein
MDEADVQWMIDRAVERLADRINGRVEDLGYELKQAGYRIDDLERQVGDLKREARR